MLFLLILRNASLNFSPLLHFFTSSFIALLNKNSLRILYSKSPFLFFCTFFEIIPARLLVPPVPPKPLLSVTSGFQVLIIPSFLYLNYQQTLT